MTRRRGLSRSVWLLVLLLAALLSTPPAGAAAQPEAPVAQDESPRPAKRFANWLREVEPLILAQERRVFNALRTDYQRDAFIQRFWRARDPYPKTARNELKVRYEHRLARVRGLFNSLDDDRSRIFLVHGAPRGRIEVRCSATYVPAEVWVYERTEQVDLSIVLVFLRGREGPARLWQPSSTSLDSAIRGARRCPQGEQLMQAVTLIRGAGSSYDLAFQRILAKPKPRRGEWLATFTSFTTDLPADAPTFDAAFHLEYPGRHQSRTVTQGVLTVPLAAAQARDFAGYRSFNFLLTGEVVLDDRLFENFRYKFGFPADGFEGAAIPLAFQRYLRPGRYTLVLKLEDMNGAAFYRHEEAIEVPEVDELFVPALAANRESADLFAEATAAVASGETSVRIVPPRDPLLTGFVRFDTLAVGEDIARVTFHLDERRLLTKNRPPFNVEIDLGDVPRPHLLRVEALDDSGAVLAEDELRLNAGHARFAVKLLEPRRGKHYDQSLLARAEVDVPDDRSLERVEFYLNERLLSTIYQPPFAQPMALPGSEELAYVRAVAYLANGQSVEDLVFVNSPGHLEEIDVQMVELYTTVFDGFGRPVEGLTAGDFEVFEDSVKQEVLRFEPVEDLPIHTAILFDNSASMAPLLDQARMAALSFFRQAITPKDRAAVITFDVLPRLAVKLTNDLRLLGGGLAGVSAQGETALYDSIMFGLYYFAGIEGQRAILLLSDGKDESSRFTFEETLDYARRAGVTLYAIGLGLRDGFARGRMARLADETGGRAFFIDEIDKLEEVYRLIQKELRSQYLLAYQSSNQGDDDAFRGVELRLSRRELTAKTLSGYYP